MRKWFLGGAIAVLALTLAGVALARFTQRSTIRFTAHNGDISTGLSANLVATDASVSQPKAATMLVIRFPPDTEFNLNTPVVATCTRSDKQLKDPVGKRCPRSSHLASGTAELNQPRLVTGGIPATIRAYAGRHSIILVIQPTLAGLKSLIIVLHAQVSSSSLTIRIPQIRWGVDRANNSFGVPVVLVTLKLNIPAHGSGANALITSGTCRAHRFVVRSHFIYDDGTKLTLRSSSACR